MNIEENTQKAEELLYTTDFPQDFIDDYKYSIGCKKRFKGEQHKHSADCERIDKLIVMDLPRSEDDVASMLADSMEGIIRYNHGKGMWEVLLDDWEVLPSDFSLHNLLRRYAKMLNSAWEYYGKLIREYIEIVESMNTDSEDTGSKKSNYLKQLADSHYFEAKKVEKMIERVGQERGFASIITLVKGHEKVRATTDTDLKLAPTMLRKASQVSEITTRQSLVKQMVPGYGIGQIFGQSQSGKSFIAHDLARHIAAGAPVWMGLDTASKEIYDKAKVGVPRDVLYIVGESPDQFRLMVEGWTESNPQLAEVSEDHFHTYINGDEYIDENGNTQFVPEFSLNPKSEETATVRSMRKMLKDSGIKPSLIIMDTQAALTGGVDENNAMAMEELVIGPLRKWANEEKVMILLVHHAGKGQDATYRGSSAQFAAMDVVWEVKASGDSREVIVKKLKSDGGFGPKDNPTYKIMNDSKTGLPYIHYLGALGAKVAQYQEKIGVRKERTALMIELIKEAPVDEVVNGKWLKEKFDISVGVVPEDVRCGKNVVDKLLGELTEEGLLIKNGTNKNIHYTVNQ